MNRRVANQRRRHGVHPDPWGEVPGVGFGQADYPGPGRAIPCIHAAHIARHRGDVDDAARVAGRRFPPREVFGQGQQRLEFDGPDLLHRRVAVGADTFAVRAPGVGDQGVQRTVVMHVVQVADERLIDVCLGKVRQVGFQPMRRQTALQHLKAQPVDVCGNDVVAGLDAGKRGSLADAAGGARDDDFSHDSPCRVVG